VEPQQSFNKDAYQVAWNWFRVHADQRMDLFKTFVVITLGLTAGYISLYNLKSYAAACGVAALGFVLSAAFKFLDIRVAALLKFGEAALKAEERRLRTEVGYDEILIVANSQPASLGFLTYRRILNVIYMGASVLFIAGFIAGYLPLRC